MGYNKYIGFGLNIESEFALPGAQTGFDPGLPTVTIRRARASVNWSELSDSSDQGGFLVAHIGKLLQFCVRDGRTILMDGSPAPDTSQSEFAIQTMSAGFALALLLRQRGLLTLHSCILHREGNTIGFVGESGWGKSTLAEFFSQHGYFVITDDIGAIDVQDGQIRVVPGHPFVKLRSQATETLLHGAPREKRELDGRVRLSKNSTPHDRKLTLDRLYLLRPSFAPDTKLEERSPQQKVLELVRHTHGNHLLTRQDYQAKLLADCTSVTEQVPVAALQRQKGIDKLPAVLKLVEDDLAGKSVKKKEGGSHPPESESCR